MTIDDILHAVLAWLVFLTVVEFVKAWRRRKEPRVDNRRDDLGPGRLYG